MKTLLTIAVAVFATVNSYSQGRVNFDNLGASNSEKVWIGAVGTENGGSLAPVGTQYLVALYYDPNVSGSPDSAFVQIGSPAAIGILGTQAGVFSNGGRDIPVGGGGEVKFQVRGWEAAFGTSYETALVSGGATGKSVVFTMDTAVGGEPVMNVRGTPNYTTGWTGFAIVPEPSAIALGLVGTGALLLLRHRK
jgi:hypothetical protein